MSDFLHAYLYLSISLSVYIFIYQEVYPHKSSKGCLYSTCHMCYRGRLQTHHVCGQRSNKLNPSAYGTKRRGHVHDPDIDYRIDLKVGSISIAGYLDCQFLYSLGSHPYCRPVAVSKARVPRYQQQRGYTVYPLCQQVVGSRLQRLSLSKQRIDLL